MDAARYARVKELFEEALGLGAAERTAFLARACGDDAALAGEVTELLRHHEAAPAFLTGPPGAEAPAERPMPRIVVRGYRIERELGRGGMGVVCLAEQERPRRPVALKFLRLDSLGPDEVKRFEREAEILGQLSHPGIAHVYGVGLAESEQGDLPWIAMEYVRGIPLGEHAAGRAGNLRDLIELFASLCDAVQHAHEKGVVHRDLKPSNVLVDESGQVRVLDFGVARLIGDRAADGGPRTRTGQMVGTLAYASPEQATGRGSEVGAPSDVYSLGVMLHELLTGDIPYPIDESKVVEAVRTICEEEPCRLRRARDDAPADLETVLLKALEKEPARRYANAGELAADLRNFLDERPVKARPPTTLYQARKFARRNRALTASVSLVILALAAALVQTLRSLEAIRAQREAKSRLVDVFARKFFALSPRLEFGEELRPDLEEILAILEQQLRIDPGNRDLLDEHARALHELGNLEQARGDHAAAEQRFERAHAICEGLVSSDPSDLRSATHLSQLHAKLGETRRDQGDVDGRDRWFGRALELDERLVAEHPDDPELLEDLGWSLSRVVETAGERGDHATALRLGLRRLADAEELVLREPDSWKYVYNLSHTHYFLHGARLLEGRYDLADEHARANLLHARRLAELRAGKREAACWLAESLRLSMLQAERAGRPDEALALAEEAMTSAFELASGDPFRAEHLRLLRIVGRESSDRFLARGQTRDAERVIRRMRHVVGLPLEWKALERIVKGVRVATDQLEVRLRVRTGDASRAADVREAAREGLLALAQDPAANEEDLRFCLHAIIDYDGMQPGDDYALDFCTRLAAGGNAARASWFARELRQPGLLADASREALACIATEPGSRDAERHEPTR